MQKAVSGKVNTPPRHLLNNGPHVTAWLISSILYCVACVSIGFDQVHDQLPDIGGLLMEFKKYYLCVGITPPPPFPNTYLFTIFES